MCLDSVKSNKFFKEWLDRQPEVIECYKVVFYNSTYKSFYPMVFRIGEKFYKRNICKYNDYDWDGFEYIPLFHFFLSKREAILFHKKNKYRKIFKCKVRKKDITVLGNFTYFYGEELRNLHTSLCVVAKEFEFIANNFPQKTKIWDLRSLSE